MTDQDKYGAYQQANQTIDEIKQVIMLYEGAINFIQQAKVSISDKDHEKTYNLIHKSISIINGLNSCLEFNEKTEKTATALDEFYQDIDLRLLHIICDHDLEACDKVIEDLRSMLNAWKDVDKEILESKNDSNENAGEATSKSDDEQENEEKKTLTPQELVDDLQNIELDI